MSSQLSAHFGTLHSVEPPGLVMLQFSGCRGVRRFRPVFYLCVEQYCTSLQLVFRLCCHWTVSWDSSCQPWKTRRGTKTKGDSRCPTGTRKQHHGHVGHQSTTAHVPCTRRDQPDGSTTACAQHQHTRLVYHCIDHASLAWARPNNT